MVMHFAYSVTLAEAYRRGDLSFAYPLMRGVAPLIVTLLGLMFLSERLRFETLAGIVLISAGIITIAWFASGRHTLAAAGWALANALIIAIYTLIDGAGARASGNAWSYAVWLPRGPSSTPFGQWTPFSTRWTPPPSRRRRTSDSRPGRRPSSGWPERGVARVRPLRHA